LSQFEFAQSIGVPKGTLLNWEQGRREPSGPAQVLLAILAKKPSLVKDLFANRRIYQQTPEPEWSPGGPHPDTMTPEARMAEVCQILSLGLVRLVEKTGATMKIEQ
jgi:DNA-binding XRE family transcriptional regulator